MPSSPISPQQPPSGHTARAESANKKRGFFGPIAGTLIIFFILGFGTLYFWGKYMNNEATLNEYSTQ